MDPLLSPHQSQIHLILYLSDWHILLLLFLWYVFNTELNLLVCYHDSMYFHQLVSYTILINNKSSMFLPIASMHVSHKWSMIVAVCTCSLCVFANDEKEIYSLLNIWFHYTIIFLFKILTAWNVYLYPTWALTRHRSILVHNYANQRTLVVSCLC